MKTLIILLLCALPYVAFSQAMQLPGAKDLSKEPTTNSKKGKKAKDKNAPADQIPPTGTGATNIGNGTASTPNRFNAAVLNTNFTVPLVRVNFLNSKASGSNALASTSFFNSAGAGVSYAWGEISQTLDQNKNVTSTSFSNEFGFQAGFLFAANTASGSNSTTNATTTPTSSQSTAIFAVMAGVSILNIQIGGGYEFGTLAAGQKRGFMTIAYAIPMSTLISGGYKIYNHGPVSANTP